MKLWFPPNDAPHLLEWWRPLLLASRKAWTEQFPWPLHLDEMMLMGRVDRASRPAIWVYKHVESRGEVYLDATGQAYKYTATPKAKGHGRFSPCDIDTALWRARLPDVVEPIWYEAPPPRPRWEGVEPPGDEVPPPPSPTRRRGHLTIHDGGRSHDSWASPRGA